MDTKQLVIDATTAPGTGSVNAWTPIGNTEVFIGSIKTQDLSKKSKINIGTLVSGIPTAFARVDLFREALEHEATRAGDGSGAGNLDVYYQQLANQWKGLVACIALDYSKINVRTIEMAYGDRKDVGQTLNVYESAGAFGNMLLERAPRWCDQTLSENQTRVPRINVIKYGSGDDAVIVGATAPECLLFTSSAYQINSQEERPWLDVNNHQFTDPLKSEMNEVETATLHAYVTHLQAALEGVEKYYGNLPQDLRPSYGSVRQLLTRWLSEIKDYATKRSFDLGVGSIPPVNAGFCAPFDSLFNFSDKLYGVDGIISEDGSRPGAMSFDPKDLLLDMDARIARIQLPNEYVKDPSKLQKLPVCLLKAEKKGTPGEYAFFALPLSTKGLNIYGKAVGALVGIAPEGTMLASQLNAVFDPNALENNLEVTLNIVTESGKMRRYTKIYTVGASDVLKNVDILMWPNFISRHWNQYYLYSELPHNSSLQTYAAFPFVGDAEDEYFRILTDDKDAPLLLAQGGEVSTDLNRVNAELLVRSTQASATNAYQYEIYRSDKPYKGVRLLSPTRKEGGYLIINYTADRNLPELPQNMLAGSFNPEHVSLGVDFGSTNTSIAYSNGVEEFGFEFTNQRVSLLGKEMPDGRPQPPRENQVFFFQGGQTPVPSNAIRSVLTIHDKQRFAPLKQGEDEAMRMAKPVIGGFPSFNDNLPVNSVTDSTITLRYPKTGLVEQIHNMKWNDPEMDKSHKKAYLGTLLLHVYAQLFPQNRVPDKLKWSYPSSMSNKLLHDYQVIWDEISDISPVTGDDGNSTKLSISKASSTYNPVSGGDMFGGTGSDDPFGGGFGGFSSNPFAAPAQSAPSQDPFSGNPFAGGDQQPAPAQGSGGNSFAGGAFSGGFDAPQQGAAPTGFGAGAFGQPQAAKAKEYPDLRPDDPNKEVAYEPVPLIEPQNSASMTEATAVANFNSAFYGNQRDTLTLCFDIGGSTTDISATYMLGPGLTMIKQNSLRFAAQRVSHATSKLPNFQRVLNTLCNQFNLSMLGINVGESKYSDETAPYFFDQVVSRLKDDQLPKLYSIIASSCPKLMCVNMYVTGLLMYYAGEIAHKLISDIYHLRNEERISGGKPQVRVTFAGKGSRLLQWLKTIDERMAQQYYLQMFVQGYGEAELKNSLAGWPQIILPDLQGTNIKYEVSKGLAKSATELFRPKDDTITEIIGEEGYSLTARDRSIAKAPYTNTLTPEMMQNIGIGFTPPANGEAPCQRFMQFAGTFYQACKGIFGVDMPINVFKQGFRDMNMTQYVQNLPEFRQAKNDAEQGNNKFDFVAPIIILEGMKFYDDMLFKALQ